MIDTVILCLLIVLPFVSKISLHKTWTVGRRFGPPKNFSVAPPMLSGRS